MMAMVRAQVQLTEDQFDALRRISAESGEPVAQLVRHGVDLYLASRRSGGRKELTERARRAAGKFSSGLSDVARNHDLYLHDAYRK